MYTFGPCGPGIPGGPLRDFLLPLSFRVIVLSLFSICPVQLNMYDPYISFFNLHYNKSKTKSSNYYVVTFHKQTQLLNRHILFSPAPEISNQV